MENFKRYGLKIFHLFLATRTVDNFCEHLPEKEKKLFSGICNNILILILIMFVLELHLDKNSYLYFI